MRNRENDLARAEVRAMLGFECKRAVAQEPARAKQHGSSSTAGLVCQSRASRQLGAGADEPHTNRKIVRRPFFRCRTRRPTLKITYSSSPRAGGCGWLCCPACFLSSPTSASMSSELGLARWTVMELSMADKHLHLPAAIMLHVLDQPRLRHLCVALGRCPASS